MNFNYNENAVLLTDFQVLKQLHSYFLLNDKKQTAKKTTKTLACAKKQGNRPKMEVYTKPHVTKLRLNYSFGLSQKWNLKQLNQKSTP